MKILIPKLTFVFALLMIISISGCQNDRNEAGKQKRFDKTRAVTAPVVKKKINNLKNDTTLVSQEFSYGALAFEVHKADINKIKLLFLDPVAIKTELQTESNNGPDSLFSLSDGVNKISISGKNGDFYIWDAIINNDRVLLNRKLTMGMKRDDFLDSLKVKNIHCDTISVDDEESTFESVYIFKNAKLQQVRMSDILE